MLVSRYLNLWVQKDTHESCEFCSMTEFSSVLCFGRMGWMLTQTRMKLTRQRRMIGKGSPTSCVVQEFWEGWHLNTVFHFQQSMFIVKALYSLATCINEFMYVLSMFNTCIFQQLIILFLQQCEIVFCNSDIACEVWSVKNFFFSKNRYLHQCFSVSLLCVLNNNISFKAVSFVCEEELSMCSQTAVCNICHVLQNP